eukprot:Clim_evm30s66 gene=Clim_evmTU30s66
MERSSRFVSLWVGILTVLVFWAPVVEAQTVEGLTVLNEGTTTGTENTDEGATVSFTVKNEIYIDRDTLMLLYGTNLDGTDLKLTTETTGCDGVAVDMAQVGTEGSIGVYATVSAPVAGVYYICVDETNQGTSDPLALNAVNAPKDEILPLPATIVFIIVLMILSGLFSGLNLGLMSLDPRALQIVTKTGEASERKYANAILPLRKRGNLLLCTLLLGNVLVNSTLTVLLESVAGGLFAVFGATALIVIFGEITPQAICSRHGLLIGYYTLPITYFFMAVTFIASWPISKCLDFALGEEVGIVYKREQLKYLLMLTKDDVDMNKGEVDIVAGALDFGRKAAEEVMTKLADVVMIDANAILDFETIGNMVQSGHSRIPVYEGERENIIGVVFAKDLAFVDPDDNMPVRTVMSFYKRPLQAVFWDATLLALLDLFKTGGAHMAVVRKVFERDGKDPEYRAVGVVTLEDVIEEIIQSEIVDETDVYVDNVSKRKLQRVRPDDELQKEVFGAKGDDSSKKLSGQLHMAVYQYLHTSVPMFQPPQLQADREPSDGISGSVLKRLLKQCELVRFEPDWKHHHRVGSMLDIVEEEELAKKHHPEQLIYMKDQKADFAVLVLEGSLKMIIGSEGYEFEAGPFTLVASMALSNVDYTTDFTAIADDMIVYLRITREDYMRAVKATRMERLHGQPGRAGNDAEAHSVVKSAEPKTPVRDIRTTPARTDAEVQYGDREPSEPQVHDDRDMEGEPEPDTGTLTTSDDSETTALHQKNV